MAFTAALVVGTGAAVASYDAAQDQKKEAKRARAEAANAKAEREAEAARTRREAYASQQYSRRQLRENSLFTGGGNVSTAGGRQTLGV